MSNQITSTGLGLNILMNCQFLDHHDWMTFASWYSVSKNLPDAVFKIICFRNKLKKQIFNWPKKCGVPLFQYSDPEKDIFEFGSELFNKKDFVIITPDIMSVSYYDLDFLGPIDCKTEINSTFVSYLSGCGKFTLSEWINKQNPFSYVDKLFSDNLKLNEYRILKIWDKCQLTYNTIA